MQVKNVVIVNDFNYIQGGASKVAIDTANLLVEKNIKVYFFSGTGILVPFDMITAKCSILLTWPGLMRNPA